ncbi:MAG: hypothetical protein M3405_12695 [Acidobacteriota bacterium]|jgi:tetratricopeptide (TPR) repeat protein|nr:hypothetical protein [Acidobacteriota bacterium]
MRYTALVLIITLFSFTLFAQTPTTNISENTNSKIKTKPKPTKKDEKAELEKAIALTNATERIAALQKFIIDYPESEEKFRALELIVSARAEIAAEQLRLSQTEKGIELFKLAVREAPTPVSDKLFESIILQIPTNVYLRGERIAAFDIAKLIEEKIGDNPKQILGLATFYLGIEYSTAARELAEKAIALEPESAVAYQTLALANRIGFNLPKAEEAYTKALELNPDSVVSRRSLAEMKRAMGKPDEAITLYREVLKKNEKDAAAKTGWILSLFDSGRRAEAEAEMKKELAANPKNVPLLVGAAYWYATKNNGEKAVELATQAVKIEPRYTWGYIALARGYMKQNDPLAAESALLAGRQFGNFPTISYELALAQSAAGFYKEAAEELKQTFTIENGKVVASLGGRVVAEGDNFIELLSLERKAGIFEATAANDLETAEKLRALLEFENKLDAELLDEPELAKAAEKFAQGNDAMKTHRDLYAANRLLDKKAALPKALELTKTAVGGVESAINAPNPTTAVLADELYEARTLAKSKGQSIAVPDIPTSTLSKIIRGRIEETAGWTFYNQGNYEESLNKLNLAMSILPKDSAWWRSVLWKRGMVLTALEKPEAALDSYIKSYASEIANGEPSSGKKIVVEALYQKINGNLDGLEDKLSAPPAAASDKKTVFVNKSVTDEKPVTSQKSNKPIPKNVPIAKTPVETPSNKREIKTVSEKVPEQENPAEKIEQVDDLMANPAEVAVNSETTSIKSEVTSKTSPSPILNESTDAKKLIADTAKPPTVISSATEKTDEETTNALFEPIVINVPKTDIGTSKKADKQITENLKDNAVINKIDSEEKAKTTSTDETGITRLRVIISDEDKQNAAEITECKIIVSQEIVSIINNGGNLGVLVGLKDRNDPKNIKAVSSSPEDIEVIYDPEVGGVDGQAFFLIKSVSTKTGAFMVAFDTPCGKKEIVVKVR